MDAGLLDVLHDGADHGGVAVGDTVDVNFGGVLEEAVDEDGTIGSDVGGVLNVGAKFVVVVDDHHTASAEDEAGADENREANAVCDGDGFVLRNRGASFGLLEADLVEEGGEELAVFGELDGLGRGADDGDAVAFEIGGKVERSLTPELDDDAVGLFLIADVENVLESEGFEVKLVRSVVVCGDGLGVGVDHDGFVAELAEGEGGVDAAVIEFNSLADAVRATAEDDDFLGVGFAGFVFVAVGRVVVRRGGFEFRSTGIDEAVSRNDAFFFSFGANVVLRNATCVGDLDVGETELLSAAEVEVGEVVSFFHDDTHVLEEPRINLGGVEDFLDGPTLFKGNLEPEDTLGVGDDELPLDLLAGSLRILSVEAKAEASGLE